MTVREFLLNKTKVKELYVVRDCGYIVMTTWIDCEDLFATNPVVDKMEVKSDSYGTIPILDHNGNTIEIDCHYIDV